MSKSLFAKSSSCEKSLLNKKGSYIIEIGLIIPIIMMILIGVIYEAIFQYQRVMMGKSVEIAANTGAVLWEREHRNPANNDIYWRLFSNWSVDENNGDQTQKHVFRLLEEKVEIDISHLIIKPRNVEIETSYIPGFLQPGKISVTTKLIYIKPFGTWWEKILGIKNNEIMYHAECAVVEPAENIRNIDLAFEMGQVVLKETGAWDKITDFGDGIKDKIQSKLTGIKNSILKRSPK